MLHQKTACEEQIFKKSYPEKLCLSELDLTGQVRFFKSFFHFFVKNLFFKGEVRVENKKKITSQEQSYQNVRI